MARQVHPQELDHHLRPDLTPIPPRPSSKKPLVKWGNGLSPALQHPKLWATGGDPFVQARQQPILIQLQVRHALVRCCSIQCSSNVQMMVNTLVILFKRSGCGPSPYWQTLTGGY